MGMDAGILTQAVKPRNAVVYVYGPPGVGKSYAAKEALVNGVGFNPDHAYQVSLNEDQTVQEIVGHYVPVKGEFKWAPGPVARSLDHGGLIVNEIQRASSAVQDFFLGVLDSSDVRRIDVTGGIRLEGHDEFRVIATSNGPIDELDEALQDRFTAKIEITHPSASLVRYLNSQMDGIGDMVYSSYDDPEKAISPREVLAYLLNASEMDESIAAQLAFGDRWRDVYNTILGLR